MPIDAPAIPRASVATPAPSIRIGTIALEIRTPAPVAPASPPPPQRPAPAATPTAPVRFSAHRYYLR
jgi:hypothetical protein